MELAETVARGIAERISPFIRNRQIWNALFDTLIQV